MKYVNLDIKNANKYRYEGSAEIEPGEAIYLKISNREVGLQIQAGSNEYKIVDTIMTDDEIKAQNDETTLAGWNTVDGDTWKDADDAPQWDGILNAIRVLANSTNSSNIKVSWGIRDV